MVRNGGQKGDGAAWRGRGAISNAEGRFERFQRETVEDGWFQEPKATVAPTHVREEMAKSLIVRNRSPDVPFSRSINPYRGCEHGCIYCFARPSHAYLGLSPGLDFETRLVARMNAPEVLERELRKRGYTPETIAVGTNTDPYQPVERERRIMRGCLQVLQAFGHPVSIVTKGTLIERDIDILAPMAAQGLVHVGVSVTTLDNALSRRMEPRVPGPKRRLEVIRRLSEAGVPVRVMVAPVVPGLSDHELEGILQAGRAAGAVAASWIMLRLPGEVAPLWQEWLEAHYPDRATRVRARLREMHGGRDYDPKWGHRMRGDGQYAEMIGHRFTLAMGRLGYKMELPALRCDLFRVPPRQGDQLDLFGVPEAAGGSTGSR